MVDKSIAIAMLARDCEKSLRHNIPKIEKLRSFFNNSIVVVVENDSVDQTKTILSEWSRTAKNVIVLSEDYHTLTIPLKTVECPYPKGSKYRIDKLSFYRNKYMEYLKGNDIDCDYLMVIDIDINDFSIDGIMETLNTAPSDWTALFANGNRYIINFFNHHQINIMYYDSYAFVPYLLNNENKVIELTYTELAINQKKLFNQLKKNNFVKCISAFGGIGLYKYAYIKGNKYYSIANKRSSLVEVTSEHVMYNMKISTKYISKKMLVYYNEVKSIKEIVYDSLPLNIKMLLFRIKKGYPFPV
ncbi:hypothetical protein FACS1894147_05210 [Spirochaetia bacterium]|nr:hypothetical protein FACS1894147_05210 [Spirochaetia bacterium]